MTYFRPTGKDSNLPSACVVRESAFHGRALRTMSNPNALLSFARTLHQTHGGSFASLKGTDPFVPTTGTHLKTEPPQNAPNLSALKNGISSKQALKTAQNLLANGHTTPVKMQSSHF